MERLDKIVSNLGYGSRKEIKSAARKGLIQVDEIGRASCRERV